VFDLINLFVQLVDAGSYTKLAKVSKLAQSTISRRMAQLEEQFQITLFTPNIRQMELTEQGKLLYSSFKPEIDNLKNKTDEFCSNINDIRGELTIILPAAFADHLISNKLPEFLNNHPKIKLIILSHFYANGNLVDFDVGISVSYPDKDNITIRTFFDDQPILIASKKYVTKYGSPSSPEDLIKHKIITPMFNDRRFDVFNFRYKNEIKNVSIEQSSKIATHNAHALIRFIKLGFGIAPIFGFTGKDLLSSDPDMIHVLPEWLLDPIRFYIVRPNNLKNHKVDLFINEVFGK